jgi:putative ABC transport system permease protein
MLNNYLLVALRQLWKYKSFSAINIGGLAVGIAACSLLLLYAWHEWSYDRFHHRADRMVRVVFQGVVQGQAMRETTVMPPVAQTLSENYPEVEDATRLRDAGTPEVTVAQQVFRGDRAAYVDSNFFGFFTLPLLEGKPAEVLAAPNTAVITQRLARKYFGSGSPVGQTLAIEGWAAPCTITGVARDIPPNSHLQVDLFLAMAGLPEARSASWMESNFFTFLTLAEGSDHRQLEARLPALIERYIGPHMKDAMGVSLAEFRQQGNDLNLLLQPLTDIHLSTDFPPALSVGGNRQYVYSCFIIALFILLIACINFMNLSTAGASRRMREVGVRKVLGSARGALAQQFMTESGVVVGLALLLSAGLVSLGLPAFNRLLDANLSANLLEHPQLLAGWLGIGLAATLIAGAYPAFFMASFRPITALKNKAPQAEGRGWLRGGLVVFQFSLSVLLMIGALVAYQQLNYIRHKDLGYDKEQVLVLPNVGALGNKLDVFWQQLEQDPRVKRASLSGYLPIGETFDNNFFVAAHNRPDVTVKTVRYDVDEHYLPTLGMELKAGRNFTSELYADSMSMLVNETAAKALGFGDAALGKTVVYLNKSGAREHYQIVGVVKDFHFRSMHQAIAPLVMVKRLSGGNLIARTEAAGAPALLSALRARWEQLTGSKPFVYSFLDERFEQAYRAEQRTGSALGAFAALAIFVACLGLFGLALFTAERRGKEIGIRKVLGASAWGIMALLTRDFLKLVALAAVLATPAAYFLARRWLDTFAYRIDVAWWMFAAAGLAAVFIALLTVSAHSLRAALVNPVERLRSE